MPLYETIFIVRQDVPSAQVEALSKTFAELVTTQGGQVKKTESWGLRTLAYRINKNRKGHYTLFNIEASAVAIAELERQMRLNEDVLRFMTVRVEAHEEGPSALLRKDETSDAPMGGRPERGDRSDRGDRGDRPRRARPETASAEGESV